MVSGIADISDYPVGCFIAYYSVCTVLCNSPIVNFLEKPEYYFDGYHLNSKGRQRFTETLVTELVGRLRSANSSGEDRSDSKRVVDRFPLDNAGPDIGRPIGNGLNDRPMDKSD